MLLRAQRSGGNHEKKKTKAIMKPDRLDLKDRFNTHSKEPVKRSRAKISMDWMKGLGHIENRLDRFVRVYSESTS